MFLSLDPQYRQHTSLFVSRVIWLMRVEFQLLIAPAIEPSSENVYWCLARNTTTPLPFLPPLLCSMPFPLSDGHPSRWTPPAGGDILEGHNASVAYNRPFWELRAIAAAQRTYALKRLYTPHLRITPAQAPRVICGV